MPHVHSCRVLSSAEASIANQQGQAAPRTGSLALLGPRAVADLRSCRRRLCEEAAELWLDISHIKLRLREKVRLFRASSSEGVVHIGFHHGRE